MYVPHNDSIRKKANYLRTHMTPYEKQLWYQFLNHYPIRFMRQYVIGSYIADFYCRRVRLVVELDGSQHYLDEGLHHDRTRTAWMERYDIQVLRFSNLEIVQNFPGVCEVIDRTVKERMEKFRIQEFPDWKE